MLILTRIINALLPTTNINLVFLHTTRKYFENHYNEHYLVNQQQKENQKIQISYFLTFSTKKHTHTIHSVTGGSVN